MQQEKLNSIARMVEEAICRHKFQQSARYVITPNRSEFEFANSFIQFDFCNGDLKEKASVAEYTMCIRMSIASGVR